MEKMFEGENYAIYTKRFLGGRLEKHTAFCICSYCMSSKNNGYHSIGFWAPINKTKNSWRVFWYCGKTDKYYFRFTFSH